MTHIESPKVVKKKLFSPIWLLPIVALILGAWLGVKSIRESGIEIQIHFPSATGIDVGKTLIKYQGLTVGKVSDIGIDEDLKGVNVKVLMDYRADPFLKKDTLFWLVTPKASITGVEGLDALFSGNYIALQPGSGRSASEFEAQREAPTILPGSEGIVVEITSLKLGSIDLGSKVFYRQIPVGSVVSYRLENTQQIVISVFIQEQYAHLVKKNSQFWNVSGLSIDASLSGIKVNTESLASILAGGISFNSPEGQANAENGDSFSLFENETSAISGAGFTLTADNGDDINAGADILYRGVTVGHVIDKRLSEQGVILHAQLDTEHSALLASDTRFWLSGAEVSLAGVKHAARLVTGKVVNLLPGVLPGPNKSHYVLESSAPDLLSAKKRVITLSAQEHLGVTIGAQVRFKQLPIGHVNHLAFSKDFKQVEYQVDILPEFIPLLTSGSYFVPESALSIKASLDGIEVKTRDLSTLVEGALSLIPGDGKVSSNNNFVLYTSMDEAKHIAAKKTDIHLSLNSHDGAGLSQGAPVYYKKMAIGQVESIQWQAKTDSFKVAVAIEKKFTSLINPNSVFWRNDALSINASLAGIDVNLAPLGAAIKGSITLGHVEHAKASNPNILYDEKRLALMHAYPVSFTLPASANISANSAIRYQGHQIGQVQAVKLSDSLEQVNAKAYLYGEYAAHFALEDSEFFIVQAQISLAGIKAPETLLTGPYIGALPGTSTVLAKHFDVKQQARHYGNLVKDALRFTLEDSQLGSIKTGTQIFYRGIPIGQVDGFSLNAKGNKVQVFAHIEPPYTHLVNQSSQFWNASGISVDMGLFSGVQVETTSIETILAGGINVLTRDVTTEANLLRDTSTVPLHSSVDKEWLSWEPAQTR